MSECIENNEEMVCEYMAQMMIGIKQWIKEYLQRQSQKHADISCNVNEYDVRFCMHVLVGVCVCMFKCCVGKKYDAVPQYVSENNP